MRSKLTLLGFLVLLLLAGVQTVFRPFKTIPLAGAEFVPNAKSLNIDHWISMDWQRNAEQRLKKTFGFRPHFVRVYNQVLYSLFDEINPQVVAKGDTLFERGYLPSILGQDFLGEAEIDLKFDSLTQFQNQLNSRGKQLFIIIAPNKWRTFHAYDSLGANTNYASVMKRFKQGGFNVIDALDYFVQHNASSPYPLHSKQGTHWSIYGAFTSAMMLQQKLQKHGIVCPKMLVDSMEIAGPRNTDKDLRDLLNVMMPPKKEQLAYPKLSFKGDTKPKALVIGDSYYWSYYYLGIHQGMFAENSPFFYYNKSVVYDDVNAKQPLSKAIRDQAFAEAEVVILVMSEPSLKWFGFGVFGESI